MYRESGIQRCRPTGYIVPRCNGFWIVVLALLYIETSIIGYLTARSRDQLIFSARQELTRRWWDARRTEYELLVSELVVDEISAGDPTAAMERLEYLEGVEVLDSTSDRILDIAEKLLESSALPQKARSDAIHVACATAHRVEYLLTWNCRHIANADQLPLVYRTLTNLGLTPPLIVTPEEFSNDD